MVKEEDEYRLLSYCLDGDEKTGAKIILKALESPMFHIETLILSVWLGNPIGSGRV